ncbi:MAG TPA: butyrate kinase [Bacillales bacterium]|nr:butyrate kinase [Bacillales bacterium]
MHNLKVLVINPGSTSTKFAIFQGQESIFTQTIRHNDEDIMTYPTIADQLDYRLGLLLDVLKTQGIELSTLEGIVGRGGFLKPLNSGTYLVNEDMLQDLKSARYGEHASNLGAMMAHKLGTKHNLPSYIVDPIVVDEFEETSRISGIPDIERISNLHALNIKAVSRKVASELGGAYETYNFVIAHIGGGVSVAAQKKGRIIDVNNANNEGPFSPERAGGLPAYSLVKLCYSGKFTEKEMLDLLTKKGGLYAYLGTKNALDAENMALAGDEKANLVLDAMIHQIAKEIGAMTAVLDGEINGIILTGGICYSDFLVTKLKKKISFLGEIFVVPGEEELEALAKGALRVLTKAEEAKEYHS